MPIVFLLYSLLGCLLSVYGLLYYNPYLLVVGLALVGIPMVSDSVADSKWRERIAGYEATRIREEELGLDPYPFGHIDEPEWIPAKEAKRLEDERRVASIKAAKPCSCEWTSEENPCPYCGGRGTGYNHLPRQPTPYEVETGTQQMHDEVTRIFGIPTHILGHSTESPANPDVEVIGCAPDAPCTCGEHRSPFETDIPQPLKTETIRV